MQRAVHLWIGCLVGRLCKEGKVVVDSAPSEANIDLKLLRCSFSHHHTYGCLFVHVLNHPNFRFRYSHPPYRRHHHLSGYCVKSFLQVDEPQSHTALYLQSLLHHLSQDVHPVWCSSPLPEPLLFSPKSYSTLLLILASKTLSSSFGNWLSSLMPLYFPASCTSPFLFHICTIRPILHSFGILPSCIHTYSSLPVHVTSTSTAISIISRHADDTDLYLIFKPSELTENVAEMERTAGLVRRWMASNELKMNDAKTEVMLITPRRMAMKIECPTMVIGDHVVAPSHFVRNLGVILDSLAGMERQINAVCKTSYMHLYNISKIRCYLDKHSLACIIHAFVTCRLDYGNALLCGYPESQIQKLQRVQNVAARLISGRRKYDHITPVLKELHWLPVVKRIQFKVVTTVFKAMHDTAPAYLQELIVPYAPSRGLRSREHNLLCVPFTRSTVAGSRAFSIAGPKLWNALPQYLRDISDISTFKKQLKTHLFLQHYGL